MAKLKNKTAEPTTTRHTNAANRGATHESETPSGARARAGYRETVESICVAIILALLFRAFVAEAFVIPTGSMAPTLMGAHKDLECSQCGSDYQVGASVENDGGPQRKTVVASVCPNCRHVNTLDLKDSPNDTTFSGDRILVSKFAYAIDDPERWDVIVFKYPGNPKQNYIKRLVGLPNETIRIRHGDIYSQASGAEAFSITRKAPAKLMAMSHRVFDSKFQAPLLLKAGYPSRLQPWRPGANEPPTDSWKVEQGADGLTATLSGSSSPQWLRYFHRWASDEEWARAAAGESLSDVDPYSGGAVTDFYAYDSYLTVDSGLVYQRPPNSSPALGSRESTWFTRRFGLKPVFRPGYDAELGTDSFTRDRDFRADGGFRRDGTHWVGDLITEFDVETAADATELTLEIVEAGVEYQCRIDLTDGTARLVIGDVEPRLFDAAEGATEANVTPTAETGVVAGERHQLRFSNADDQLLLWVDGDVVSFNSPTTFDASQFRSVEENHPHYTQGHPLDAAPAGIAVSGGAATVHRINIRRDQYYIATNQQGFMADYNVYNFNPLAMQELMRRPLEWEQEEVWNARRSVEFTMDDDQFFPMGDNSPESKDARCWVDYRKSPLAPDEDAYRFADVNYVPRDLLVGKAIYVFWPHPWKRPIPYWPNFERMGLIR